MTVFKKIFHEPPQADLLRISREEVIRDLAGRLFPVVAPFGLILGILSIVQTLKYGWYPSYSLDIFLYLAAVAVLAFHKKLSTRAVACLIMLLVATDGLLTLFAGGIAHDFNNRLAGILGNAEFLRAKCTDQGETRSALDGIIDAARSLADVVSKLLTFARNSPAEFSPVDIHSLINDVETILAHSIPTSISIVKHLDAERCVVAGDRVLLQNTLLNLAINARDAMPSGGELRFETGLIAFSRPEDVANTVRLPAGEYLKLRVSDTGCGIDPSIGSRIFDPFFTTKAKGKGTGLGLALVYGAVKAHRGVIDMRSELGKGTEFIIYLPLADEKSAKSREENRAVRGGDTKKRMRIMVIEDEDSVALMTVRLLEMNGHQVRRFRDGREAVESLNGMPGECDLILLDLTMPRMNGRETFDAIHAMLPAVPVIIMSGYSEGSEVREILNAGAVGFLQKPFTMAELKAKIDATVR